MNATLMDPHIHTDLQYLPHLHHLPLGMDHVHVIDRPFGERIYIPVCNSQPRQLYEKNIAWIDAAPFVYGALFLTLIGMAIWAAKGL